MDNNKQLITRANGKRSIESRIKSWFRSREHYDLCEADNLIYKQTLFIWQRLSDRVRTEMIVKQCHKLFGICRKTVYNRINFANDLLGNAIELDRNAERAILKMDLIEALGWAKDARDYNGIQKLINTYADVMGLKNEDAIIPHFDNIQPQHINLIASDKEIIVMKKMLDNGSLDVDALVGAMDHLSKAPKVEAEDIDHEVV